MWCCSESKKRKLFLIAGAAASIIYVFAVVLGGLLRPGYSHVSQAISELLEVGAPNISVLAPLFALYNLLTATFALALLWVGSKVSTNKGLITIVSVVLLVEATAGFVTIFFAEDIPGTAVTPTGGVHIALAGLCSLCTMLAIFFMGIWFRRTRTLPGYGLYSFATLALVFISGGTTAFTTAEGIPLNGLAERITIGGYLQWMTVLALGLFLQEMREWRARRSGGKR